MWCISVTNGDIGKKMEKKMKKATNSKSVVADRMVMWPMMSEGGYVTYLLESRSRCSTKMRRISVCRHLGSQLLELEKMIDHMMHEEFVRFATLDLNRPVTEQRTPTDEVRSLNQSVFTLTCWSTTRLLRWVSYPANDLVIINFDVVYLDRYKWSLVESQQHWLASCHDVKVKGCTGYGLQLQ